MRIVYVCDRIDASFTIEWMENEMRIHFQGEKREEFHIICQPRHCDSTMTLFSRMKPIIYEKLSIE